MKPSLKWRLKDAMRAFKQRFKRPLIFMHSANSLWPTDDHHHICLAVRLLQEDDFIKVCPRWGCVDAENDDICEACEYFKILDFHKGGFGYQDWFTIFGHQEKEKNND